MKSLCRIFLVISFVLFSPGALLADTFLVTKTADSNDHTCDSDCSLREAIEAANGNPGADVITVPDGTYLITIGSPTIYLITTDNVTINGGGETSTIIDGDSGSATGGAPLLRIDASVTINDLTVQNNGSGSQGVGVGIQQLGGSVLNLTNVTISDHGGSYNGPVRGAGITSDGGLLSLYRSTVRDNSGIAFGSDAYGGGIYISSASLYLSESTVSGNSVSGATPALGGGIFALSADLRINNSTVSGNTAVNGGGIWSDPSGYSNTVEITNSTVSGNTASGDGGGIVSYGIYSPNTTSMWVSNSTVSGNSAANGGGIWSYSDPSLVTLLNSTVVENSASSAGGGIYNSGGVVGLENSIVANSPTGGNCGGAVTSWGHNVTDDSSCGFSWTGDQVVADAKIGPLADHGGPTQTHALWLRSPAIDAASGACPAADQRGMTRPPGKCDVGSYERDSFVPPHGVPALPSAWGLLVASLACSAVAFLRRRRPA